MYLTTLQVILFRLTILLIFFQIYSIKTQQYCDHIKLLTQKTCRAINSAKSSLTYDECSYILKIINYSSNLAKQLAQCSTQSKEYSQHLTQFTEYKAQLADVIAYCSIFSDTLKQNSLFAECNNTAMTSFLEQNNQQCIDQELYDTANHFLKEHVERYVFTPLDDEQRQSITHQRYTKALAYVGLEKLSDEFIIIQDKKHSDRIADIKYFVFELVKALEEVMHRCEQHHQTAFVDEIKEHLYSIHGIIHHIIKTIIYDTNHVAQAIQEKQNRQSEDAPDENHKKIGYWVNKRYHNITALTNYTRSLQAIYSTLSGTVVYPSYKKHINATQTQQAYLFAKILFCEATADLNNTHDRKHNNRINDTKRLIADVYRAYVAIQNSPYNYHHDHITNIFEKIKKSINQIISQTNIIGDSIDKKYQTHCQDLKEQHSKIIKTQCNQRAHSIKCIHKIIDYLKQLQHSNSKK